jgi:hypothetical protein
MKKMNMVMLVAGTVLALVRSAHAAPDVSAFLKQKNWDAYDSRGKAVMPVDDIAAVTYFAKGANAPSCGLLQLKAPVFIDILSAEDGDQFPQCTGVDDAVAFALGGKKYVVLTYTDRQTREESYRRLFFVYQNSGGAYVADEKLNGAAVAVEGPHQKAAPVLKAAAGIKMAKAEYFRAGVPAAELIERDLIADEATAFAVFKAKSAPACIFALDAGQGIKTYDSGLFAADAGCKAFVASGRQQQNDTLYYIGLFDSTTAGRKLALFSITKGRADVKAETELAAAITQAGGAGDIKSVKKYLSDKK